MSFAGGDELESALTAGVRGLGLTANGGQIAALLGFLHLMQKWGKTYNLTAIRDLRAAVDLHLLDSLAVSPFLEGRSILDVGTGAGLPGLPLAILHPERRFVLLDASAKKVRFVRQVTLELGLRNVEVVVARVEDAVFEETFDRVMARAFASLLDIRHLASRFLSPEGRILALKGRLGEQEMAAVEGGIIGVHALRVPGLDAERHVVELSAGFIHG
ncbi:MAG: 16S rRNA (guanine(527)-N(7))-methyltransferase RsmG [Methylococcus sp.]|nr:MAG: 16S rRNA (guanine(527)-N(7))-methyltransferase RsmG [Methylococcus sp.]